MKVTHPYLTRTKGIGGEIKAPEDFVVTERLEKKFLRSFDHRTAKPAGSYHLVYFVKRLMTTHDALRSFGVRAGVAGLKDKFSVSYQYATTRSIPKSSPNPRILWMRRTNYWLTPGSLEGNEFRVTLHGARAPNHLLPGGVPNYFGPQRFGRRNHVIGKSLVKREYRKALELINASYRKQCRSVGDVPKWKLKFFVNAYQSWLFNGMLAACAKKRLSGDGKLFGSRTMLGRAMPDRLLAKLATDEGIRQKDFQFPDLRLSCPGGARALFVKPDIEYEQFDGGVVLSFFLPKGSYASVVLNEVCKKNPFPVHESMTSA